MSRLTFVPWVRSGAAAAIATVEDLAAPLPYAATFDVRLRVNTQPEGVKTVSLHGPGDVVGIDPRQIVRTDPRPGTLDFEPNYFPLVEFARPDFPWLFTTVRARGDVLRPWIALVVVPLGPGVVLRPSSGALPAALELQHAGQMLPGLDESWAWAHAQASGDLAGASVADVLAGDPSRGLSRILCPRRLQPEQAYVACLVPTTEAGRLAGLGESPGGGAPQAAWRSDTQQLDLPAYYTWEFATGVAGDFESLAALLRGRDAPPATGSLRVEGDAPGAGLPSAGTIDFLGALVAPRTTPGPSPPASFQAALRARLDAPTTLTAADPSQPGVIAPPPYGALHAGRDRIPDDVPHWLRELNLEPRSRAAAGLGTRVVQEEQEALMASAWEQVGAVEEANEALRRAQLARAAGRGLHASVAVANAGVVLQLTRTTHARVHASPTTVAHEVDRSALPAASLAPAFRRIARPAGPVGRRLRDDGGLAPGRVVERLNAGEIAAAKPRHPPDGTVGADEIADALLPSWFPRWLRPWLARLPLLLLVLALVLVVLAAAAVLAGLAVVGIAVVAVAAAAIGARQELRRRSGRWRPALEARPEALTPALVAGVPARPAFAVLPEGTRSVPADAPAGAADSPAAAAFREAARERQAQLSAVMAAAAEDRAPAPSLDLPATADVLMTALDPRVTVPAAVLARLRLPRDWTPDDPIEEVMAAPSFPAPMYAALRDHFKDLAFPGIDGIPQDSVTVLQTNPAFIEAYMAGLNHEMGRELLWREYPTDQRGTPFRHFWDTSARIPAPATEAEREQLRDIPPMHLWREDAHLGGVGRSGRPPLVLLVRGRLLARYPTTVIYASKANARPGGNDRRPIPPPDEQELYPLFSGRLPPDITFVGFDLGLDEARGGPAPADGAPDPGPGWFFVLQQHPTEPRFGFDEPTAGAGGPPTAFRAVSWADVAVHSGHLDIGATLAGPVGAVRGPAGESLGGHSATFAYATLQDPFLVAISADDMLPA